MFLVNACEAWSFAGCMESGWRAIVFNFAIPTLYQALIALGVVFILVNSIRLITSAGDSKAREVAVKQIVNNVIGFAVVLLVSTIFVIITSLFGGIQESAKILPTGSRDSSGQGGNSSNSSNSSNNSSSDRPSTVLPQVDRN
jgi:hypothetical protein